MAGTSSDPLPSLPGRPTPALSLVRDVDANLRARIVGRGILSTLAVVACAVAYVVSTWAGPHRSALLGICVGAAIEAIVLAALPRRWLVAPAVSQRLLLGWSVAHVAVGALCAWLDGGIGSPFISIFFLSVAFTGGGLGRPLVIVVVAANVLATTALAVLGTGGDVAGGTGVMQVGMLLVLGGVSVAFARDREWQTAAVHAAQDDVPRRLARVVEYRDNDTGGHVERMAEYVFLIACAAGLSFTDATDLRLASTMHDIGKVAVPDAVLLKPGKLTADERAVMETHAAVGYEMLKDSGNELLDLAATVALTHHERFDGRGYPNRLRAEEIPLPGRIVAVADVFDAITSKRVYKQAEDVGVAVDIIRAGAGTQFDPAVVGAFEDALDVILAVRARCTGASPGEQVELAA